MVQDYNAEHIQTLSGIEHIRHRPSMYIGSIEAAGLHQITLEIISNSVDEYLNGGATAIDVELTDKGSIIVTDNGRGIPIGKHESGCSVLEAVFGITNTGAKYDNEGQSGYNSSGGTNGIGAKATNALSTYFRAETFRDGVGEQVIFSRGDVQSHTKVSPPYKGYHGVTVEFIPDSSVLNVVEFDYDKIYKQLEELSYLCKGLSFTLSKPGKADVTFCSQNGLLDYISSLNKGVALCEPFYCNTEGLEVALVWNINSNYVYKLYTNNIPQTKGTHHTGFKTALTATMNKYAREKGLIKEKEENLQGSDLEEGQVMVLSLRYLNPIYEGQNKENLTSADARGIVQKIAGEELRNWLESHPKDAKAIIDKASLSRKAREAAKKARAAVKSKNGPIKTALKQPSKLTDAFSTNRKECEIFIVEGDSAAGGMKQAKSNKTQAILPVRGKILNVLKAPMDKVLANAEIENMIHAFGGSVDKSGIHFDTKDLRYGKIIIAADADVDGAHIQSLFYTFIWTYAPELIELGYIYATLPPLYKIPVKGGYEYLQDDAALRAFQAKHPGKKFEIKRFKGLGEMNPDDLEEVFFNPKTRVLKQITLDDAQAARALFNQLMGDSAALRRDYIEKHSDEVEVFI